MRGCHVYLGVFIDLSTAYPNLLVFLKVMTGYYTNNTTSRSTPTYCVQIDSLLIPDVSQGPMVEALHSSRFRALVGSTELLKKSSSRWGSCE